MTCSTSNDMKKDKSPTPERGTKKKERVRTPKPERAPKVPVPDRGVAPGITG
jgi:hypothetical protein